jgi:hypothetical protein
MNCAIRRRPTRAMMRRRASSERPTVIGFKLSSGRPTPACMHESETIRKTHVREALGCSPEVDTRSPPICPDHAAKPLSPPLCTARVWPVASPPARTRAAERGAAHFRTPYCVPSISGAYRRPRCRHTPRLRSAVSPRRRR